MKEKQPFSCTDVLISEDETKATIKIQDRLSYHIPEFLLQKLRARPKNSTYWSHEWYQNAQGKKVKVSYASTREASEELAKVFLNEKVLGFDMEWKADRNKKRRSSRTLKDEISLIQISSSEEIGLFHIALHEGSRPAQLLAPSLRRIIESSSIIKTGVGIYSADASRLRKFMGLKPQGILDLNFLHRLVDLSSRTRMTSLSDHAKIHLGFPLFKGDVRTSDWTKSLTSAQQNYAASDAYVGLVLYHVLDAKRLNMDPIPPHPELDKNLRSQVAESVPNPAQAVSTQTVVGPDPSPQVRMLQNSGERNVARYSKTYHNPPAPPSGPVTALEPDRAIAGLATPAPTLTQSIVLDNKGRRLLANLHSLRYRLQKSTGMLVGSIASDKTLQDIASQRPTTIAALCRIPGAGKLLMTCNDQKANLLDCIITPPTSISFDSSLSCANITAKEPLQLEHLDGRLASGNARKRISQYKERRPEKKQKLSSSDTETNYGANTSLFVTVPEADKGRKAEETIPAPPIFTCSQSGLSCVNTKAKEIPRREALAEVPLSGSIQKRVSS
jgi:hypothetical protein